MKILFVYGSLDHLGGIETLIVRASRTLHQRGHQVSILLQHRESPLQSSPLFDEASRHATIYQINGWLNASIPSLRALNLPQVDYVYAFESYSLLLSLLIHTHVLPEARVAAGVYFSREYCWKSVRSRYQQRMVEDVFRRIPLSNIFFMSSDCALEHGACLSRDFSNSPIVPLPVDTDRFAGMDRQVNSRKIVSIGRVTDFKTYNFTMLDVLKNLNGKGLRFEYHIHGDGEQLGPLRQQIKQRSLEGQVFLHGSLPYSEMETALQDAFAFVGMGTAAIEAASAGVPAIIAIESSETAVTYGMFHESQGRHIGYVDPEAKEYLIEDILEGLAGLPPDSYHRVSEETRQTALKYSSGTTMERFVALLEETAHFSYAITSRMRFLQQIDLWYWRVLKRMGVTDPNRNRLLKQGSTLVR